MGKVEIMEKEKGSGVWWVFFRHENQKIERRVGGKKEASAVAKVIESKTALGTLGIFEKEKKQNLFSEYAAIWLDGYVKHALKINTYRGYESILRNHLNPEFGTRNLEDVSRAEVKDFLFKKLGSGLSRERVKRINASLSGIYTNAIADELVEKNPASGMDRYFNAKDEALEEKMNPYTADELELYLKAVKEHFPYYHPFFLTLARTGMRLSEALALQWDDIDFQGNFIEVWKGLTEKNEITTPKSGKKRRVTMSPELKETLINLKFEREEQALKAGWGKVPELVFVNSSGNPINRGNLANRVHYKIFEKTGLKRIRMHDIRHSYASIRIAAGHNIADVSKELGHKSIKITIDIYYHCMPGGNLKEVSELDVLGKPQGMAEASALKCTCNAL